MRFNLALLLVITIGFVGFLLPAPRAARACGGGLVTAQPGSVGADAQRIIISARDGTTDVITQIGVPNTTANYGVLLPLPSEPTLDSTPVTSADIDNLDRQTAPRLIAFDNNEGGIPVPDCGCGSTKGGANSGGSEPGVRVSAPVAIGPVTAVTLTADTGDAINGWLADNGFMIAAADQSLVADYAGPGRYFIAIRRSDVEPTQSPSSVGVHFTLAGDQRGLPMRFARMGGAPIVAFTVFIAAYTVAAPADPFAALTLDDLDRGTLNTTGYAGAVSKAVSDHGNHAFVLEGSWSVPTLPGALGPSLAPFVNARQTLTRMSTRVPVSALDADVALDRIYSGPVPNQRVTQRTSGRHPRAAFAFAAFALAAFVRRRPRR
jgi:hypothetical protein